MIEEIGWVLFGCVIFVGFVSIVGVVVRIFVCNFVILVGMLMGDMLNL